MTPAIFGLEVSLLAPLSVTSSAIQHQWATSCSVAMLRIAVSYAG